jgi:uncharacterized membrane protein YhaH (DUF805 family)
MRDEEAWFSPWGRTSRSHYWLIVGLTAILFFGAISAQKMVGTTAIVAPIIAAGVIVTIATIRRLHDAGWSRWWAMLYLFPMKITVDLFTVHVGSSAWHFLDVQSAITQLPVLIGLLASSKSDDERRTRLIDLKSHPNAG